MYSNNATKNVVTFPSIIAAIALLKLLSKAFFDPTLFLNSSFNLSKMITFASTAIPIDSISPAIPGSVMLIPVFASTSIIILIYATKEILETKPGSLYIVIIIKQISIRATIPAWTLTFKACWPIYGPMYSLLTTSRENGRAPEEISIAYSSAWDFFSAYVPCPIVIIAVLDSILLFTIGEATSFSSKYIDIAWPTNFSVASVNFLDPLSLNSSTTCGEGSPVLSVASSLYFASFISSPSSNMFPSGSLNIILAVLSSPSTASNGSFDWSLISAGISTLICEDELSVLTI